MTTTSTATVIDHTSTAGFRAWGLEFSTQNAAVGLIQTADTGQINWTTVTIPGTTTAAGYEIWKFSDSSLFMKIEYGTGGATTTPAAWITVGTGSNGSGTLTGQLSTRNTFIANAMASPSTAYTSRWCHTGGNAYSVSWKEAGSSVTMLNGGTLVVGKTTDGAGAATTVGFGVLRTQATVLFQSVRIAATAQTFNDVPTPGFVPGLVTTTSVAANGNKQAYDLWLNVPDVIPFVWANIVLTSEAARGTSYPVAQVGAVSHTYVSLGNPSAVSGLCATGVGTNYALGIIFE